ncbi:putative stress responsive a b barrel domain-containing protein [Phaeoacremonium minimum UCRPA7]|uniref:Putative stress responsive a b barrel domain-containing protein n=1 Tax=Phaeoacremonium minimum (strain UCR-PA7) TaxID=1286976 RepID=R8BHH1_PHAM7|nr:putative stress responsive a b barrel domain-containing protein [Phaeoacremonium minimum UCRPA7]EON98758.1 putative stress responsive a b barrel domain-containing protein [Phaeoacremonium minimum UCRPA7]
MVHKLIHRVTMFKLPGEEAQKGLLAAYDQLAKDQKKDGKPYIPFICAGVAMDDPRTKGYTIVAKTEFWSLEDLQYYDKECEAHAALKKTAATLGLAEPPLTVYFEGSPTINFTGTDPNASS